MSQVVVFWAESMSFWHPSFVLSTQHLTIYQKKISSIRIQITSTNAEFNGEFNDRLLKIQIEGKMAEEKKQKRHFQQKIKKNYKKFHKRKLTQSEFK